MFPNVKGAHIYHKQTVCQIGVVVGYRLFVASICSKLSEILST
jgi:hypothetical protein